ncbi:MAG: preprotein translocase subunit SecA [Nitrospinae bacterium]|nr:preprotein translocase subunit SecA [Nitrospinota bacterium]
MISSVFESSKSMFKSVFGTANDRMLKQMAPIITEINSHESRVKGMTDLEMRKETERFKERLSADETLDNILPEVFALVREAGWRRLQMRHFDVQLIGGIILHDGKIAEMKTGEGKTLVATLAAYLNALEGNGVHIVTVNDYLASRDSEWMGRLFRALGLSVGCIQHGMDDDARRRAYACDITYGTNNEFGFDYLRDNMKFEPGSRVMRELNFAIVDEVDSILIDEARTPLIISGPADEATRMYGIINRVIRPLLKEQQSVVESDVEEEGDGYVEGGKDIISKKKYEYLIVDEKSRTVNLKEAGGHEAEKLLRRSGIMANDQSLYDMNSITVLHHVEQALKAHVLFTKDIDYVVKDNEVVIVDEFTGRMMPGRRFSDGLHQALEAKEGVKIQEENVTLATITFQNYFRLYNKLAGMTGTADTEAAEFNSTYKIDVAVVPTNRELIRTEYPDVVYRSEREKLDAVVDEILECHKNGQPVLVGTINIEKSERLASTLKRRRIPHHVLNAKNHSKEAEIIAQAGRKGAVTISTNMAGRGTDILLGGNPEFLASSKTNTNEGPEYEEALKDFRASCQAEHDEVVKQGGLHVLGTERHESRRIDNQLRGRSGRQGDPGSSRFFLSLEDDLLRIFGSDRIKGLMEKLGMEEGVPIEANMVTRAIENAQKRVEAHHFEMRKHLLEYDDVMNKQREVIYSMRQEILEATNGLDQIKEMASTILDSVIDLHFPEAEHFDDWDIEAFAGAVESQYGIPATIEGRKIIFSASEPMVIDIEEEPRDELAHKVHHLIQSVIDEKYRGFDPESILELSKLIYIQILDTQWKDHLTNIEQLKEGIGLRGYAQVNPLNEYKKEAFDMFGMMTQRIEAETVLYMYRLDISDQDIALEESRHEQEMVFSHADASGFGDAPAGDAIQTSTPVRRTTPKVGRNEPCPCGSGKKYKFCCGRS